MRYEEWFLEQVQNVINKNAYSDYRYTGKDQDELAKSIKTSLKKQKVFPQNNWEFERKINFGILKFTKFSIKQIVNITKFYYQDLDKDYQEFYEEFKSHKHFFSKHYMKSNDYGKIPYGDWFYKEFSKAHKEFNDNFKDQLKSLNKSEN